MFRRIFSFLSRILYEILLSVLMLVGGLLGSFIESCVPARPAPASEWHMGVPVLAKNYFMTDRGEYDFEFVSDGKTFVTVAKAYYAVGILDTAEKIIIGKESSIEDDIVYADRDGDAVYCFSKTAETSGAQNTETLFLTVLNLSERTVESNNILYQSQALSSVSVYPIAEGYAVFFTDDSVEASTVLMTDRLGRPIMEKRLPYLAAEQYGVAAGRIFWRSSDTELTIYNPLDNSQTVFAETGVSVMSAFAAGIDRGYIALYSSGRINVAAQERCSMEMSADPTCSTFVRIVDPCTRRVVKTVRLDDKEPSPTLTGTKAYFDGFYVYQKFIFRIIVETIQNPLSSPRMYVGIQRITMTDGSSICFGLMPTEPYGTDKIQLAFRGERMLTNYASSYYYNLSDIDHLFLD